MPTNRERALSLLYDKFMTGQRYTHAELMEMLERYFPAYRGRMLAIEMREVKKKDGALNCISWQYDPYDMDLQDLSVSFV